MKTSQISFSGWVDKQSMVYPCFDSVITMLFSHEKEWDNDICYNVDVLRQHQTNWKKPVTKTMFMVHLHEISTIGVCVYVCVNI